MGPAFPRDGTAGDTFLPFYPFAAAFFLLPAKMEMVSILSKTFAGENFVEQQIYSYRQRGVGGTSLSFRFESRESGENKKKKKKRVPLVAKKKNHSYQLPYYIMSPIFHVRGGDFADLCD